MDILGNEVNEDCYDWENGQDEKKPAQEPLGKNFGGPLCVTFRTVRDH